MLAPLLMLALSQTASTVADHNRGSRLYQQCRSAVRVADENYTSASVIELQEGARCISYIDGFTDGLDVARSNMVCDDDATFMTMARVYVKYMEEHPILMDSVRADGLLKALRSAYSCQTK